MRLCIIADYAGNADEGMKKVAFHLTQELSRRHPVLSLDSRRIFLPGFWHSIRDFDPQVIHYMHGPSIASFIGMKGIKIYHRRARTVMSAMHPAFYGIRGLSYGVSYAISALLKDSIPLLKPDLILTQSDETEQMFIGLGCKTRFLPCGVDIEKFIPATREIKQELRGKYRVDKEQFVILHVGALRKERNIEILGKIKPDGDEQIIIVGTTSSKMQQRVYYQLKEKECSVWTTYFSNIEEIYAMADCYIFPTIKKTGSIEMPLTVLEAMSCNLPVISTRFGALPKVFKERDGLAFAEKEEEFVREVKKVKNGKIKVRNRDRVLPYSWEHVAERLERFYKELLSST